MNEHNPNAERSSLVKPFGYWQEHSCPKCRSMRRSDEVGFCRGGFYCHGAERLEGEHLHRWCAVCHCCLYEACADHDPTADRLIEQALGDGASGGL